MLKDSHGLTFRYRHIKSKETGEKTFNIKAYEDITQTAIEKPTKTTLYIPLSKSYPDIDCLTYDSHEDRLYPIQITLTQKNHKDSYHNWKKNAEEKWLKVFGSSQVTFIWLIGHPKKYTRKDQNYWVVTFNTLPETNQIYFRNFRDQKVKLAEKLAAIDEKALEVEENSLEDLEDDSESFE